MLIESNEIFNTIPAGIEELDELNESPHALGHSDTVALTAAESVNADEEDVIFTRANHKNGTAYS